MRIAFLGLGVMGYPMAGHLQRQGHEVTVFNRTEAKATAWVAEYSGRMAQSPELAVVDAEMVFACVGNDNDITEVCTGANGAFQAMTKGSVFVDHTTASATVAKTLAFDAQQRGLGFLDAPVSGGQAGAENGQLTVMVGGQQVDFDVAETVMAAYAKCIRLLGDSGSGQLAKMVNQICIAGLVQGLAEGLQFAQKSGLDGAAVVEVISQGAAQSWQMENRHKSMLSDEFDFGFAVNWMRKDLDIALRQGREINAKLPVTALVDQFYADIQSMGGGRWDTSSLLRRLT